MIKFNAKPQDMDVKLDSDAKKARAFEKIDSQFVKHDVKKPSHTADVTPMQRRMIDASSMEALTPNGRVLGLNEFGRPTATFVYGNDRTTEKEYECDIDLQKMKDEIMCVGVQMLCPKCGSPLYVRGKGLENGHEIFVHWEKMTRSMVDGKYRPLITIEGTFGCDYSDAEINGISNSRNSHVLMRCNWRGGIYMGRCFDHAPRIVGAKG